ncbi:PREDICTED: protein dachsous-like [Branchiostoma belcheri]|uniref:Protein dachsous-like n=1 Tax=Branchiostoma belcheri TaxID=7741 RepID=A0A6P4ZHP3_BRABE|nr:PREDICTED: protein dachsous-like [Branchiostoma belcheri]
MPSFITFTEITENSINITWGSADGAKDNYSISISPADGDNPTGSVDDGEPLEYLFTGLMGWTFYTVSIRTVSGGVTSEENWAARRTDVAPPRNVSIVEATENSINITWAAAAGNKDSYFISISPRDGDNHAGTVYDGDPLEYTFTGLTPGTLYTISVVTEASKRESVASTKIQRTKPNPPRTITTDTVSASIAAWEPSTGGVVSGYGVLFTSDDGSPRHTVTVDNATSNTASSPVALATGALYTLEVFAFSDEGGYRTESDRTIITNITRTLAPTPLLQTCGPSFARINILEETSSATTYTVSIPDVTSCQNCSIVYGKATCFIDDMFNVSSFVVANSSSGTTCNLIVNNPIDRETTPSVRFGISWTRMVYNLGHVVSEECGSIPVEITVEDVNDNPPVFGADLVTTFYLRDRTPVQTILAVASAEDADTGENAAVAYSIPSATASEYFEVDNSGVVTARRELTQNLLRHVGLLLDEQVEVVVMATDGVHNATTTLPFTFIDTGGVNTTSSKFGVSVPEEQPPGTPVINLRDKRPFDDGDIIYSFTHTSKSFELNSTSGEVTTAKVLDREEEELYELTISAADPGGCYSSASIEITVQVEDVNDHSPVFLETAYSGRIAENADTGQPVAIDGRGISATDADFGLNSHITYSIDCCQNVFAIDNNTGEITTIAGLDRENTPVYHLTIVAEDNPSNESLRRESRANLTISVLDINDHSPTFIEISPVRMSLYENETEGSIIATFVSVDPDEGANGRVFYEIRSGAEGRFTVNSRTGEVRIADELDRETKDFYRLEILASDGGNPPLVTDGFYLEITVEDVNDNTPAFTAPDYELTVLEETEVGTVLGNIKAEDSDIGTNAQIQYSFTEAVENFAIDENTGTLTVVSVLDFDNATHPKQSSFKVQASDGTFSSTVEVRVSLTDINDNPPAYRADIYEVTLLYVTYPAIVTAVDATDKDSGTNAEVSYSLVDDSSTLFSIDSSNGIIRLVGPSGSIMYNITVAATDKGNPPMNSTVSVSIKISTIDTSDTRVSFNGVEFEGHVEENNDDVQVATQLHAAVQYGSTPAPADCPLKYKMAASSDDSEFTVNETTGEISTRGARFDRETRARYTFAVVVEISCPGKSFDYTSVTIHVNDTNDENPTFDSSSYNFEALEGTTGVVVGTVLATDMDTGSNADFSYTIYPNGSPFSIDANGAITVSTPLDRETTDSYTLTILAEDMGVPSLNGTTTVHVRVLDINDHAPAFAAPAYRTDLREDENKAELNISISASDEDSGTNGDIRFSLHGEGSDLFLIDDMSGVVHLTGRLDYEDRPSYNLTIAATDKGHPNRTSTAPLLVEVTDVNDNPPVFERDNYNASTHRNVPTEDVLVTVSATDQDSGVNALVFYTITGQYGLQPAVPTIGEAMFNITSSTGDIRATTHLFQDDIHQYELIITATDMGEPQLSATTKVVIDVANTNFFAPEFLDTPVLHTMSEDSGVLPFLSRRVRTIRASDNDTEAEGQVRILLSSNDDISELFWITGTRTLSEDKVFEAEIWTNAILDRETHPSGLNITVLAVDQGATPKTSTAWVHVTLDDVNDNPPNLTVPERVAIPQSSPPGTSVVTLEVVDPDVNNQFSFEAVSEYFSIRRQFQSVWVHTYICWES